MEAKRLRTIHTPILRFTSRTLAKRVGTFLLLAHVLIATASRSLRLPNDFAETHWLLDDRDGPLRRGLPGELLARLANAFLVG